MRCPECEHENPLVAKFCGHCRARLEIACRHCGQRNSPQSSFCNGCGQRLDDPSSPRGHPPGSYTPKYLTQGVLTYKSALEGERKQVTVLFVDIVESSRLAEHLDPEVMHELMDEALGLMAQTVHRYLGTVNQFLGDGLMALFGAPVALEDHAVRAVEASMAIHETISGYSEQLRRKRGLEVRLRQGLNSGLVVVGKIGDDLRVDYTAVGDTTNLAARLQTIAGPGEILVSEITHHLVEGYVRSEPLGRVEIKGRSQPVQLFRITGRRSARTRLQVSADAGLTELIGRRQELEILEDRLARAISGRGQVVGILGEAGVGKSRLIHEFHKSLGDERITWLEGHCVSYGQGTPYLPILEICRTNFQIEEGDNPLQIEEKLRQGVDRLDSGHESLLPPLRELLGLGGEGAHLSNLEPQHRQRKIFEAIRGLTFAGSRRRPIVLVVEDLHWIDRSSEDCLCFLFKSLSAVPVVVITTHRSGYSVPWAGEAYYTQLALDLLSEAEMETMVARVLGSSAIPRDVLRIVRDKAEGNPLFIEEIMSSLRERGVLVGQSGGYSWGQDVAFDFPGTLQDIIRARLDRLDEPVKRTAQTAAVIGRQFGVTLLARVCEIGDEAPRHLETLKRFEFIHEKRLFPELEYMFKHAVIHDVVYQTLLMQRRKQLHGAIGGAIEELYADRLEEQAPVLAYHYARSEGLDRAIHYALLAGDRAARLYANSEATAYYDQALTMVRALPRSALAQRTEIDTILRLAAVGVTQKDVIQRDQMNLESARTLAETLNDEARLARVLYWLGRTFYVLWQPSTALEYASSSLEIAERLGDEALAAPSVSLMGRIYWQQSQYARASEALKRSVEQMRRLGNKAEECTAAGFAGFALAYMGDLEEAKEYVEHGFTVAQELQNPFAEAALYLERAIVRGERREWSAAMTDFENARRVAERAGDLFRVYVVKFFEGHALTIAGNPGGGRVLIEESLALGEQLGTRFALAWAKAFLAEALSALGEIAAVPSLCQEAIKIGEETGDRFPSAFARRILAETYIHLSLPDLDRAERAILEAIQIHQEIGTRPELARSYVTYARLLNARGDRERGGEYLSKAQTLFSGVRMTGNCGRVIQEEGKI